MRAISPSLNVPRVGATPSLISANELTLAFGYQRLLEQSGDMRVVAQASRADEAITEFATHSPDVTVTDLSMRKVAAAETIKI